MSIEQFPGNDQPSLPEHMGPLDPDTLEQDFQRIEERKLINHEEACTDLRAEVLRLLESHDIEAGIRGAWACFIVAEKSVDDTETQSSHTNILVLCDTTLLQECDTIGKDVMPVMRIISNERFVTNSGTEWLTYDFSLDNKNRARYLCGTINVDPPKDLTFLQQTSPLFCITDDGNLSFSKNFRRVTPTFTITYSPETIRKRAVESSGGKSKVAPFGTKDCLEDRIHALNVGRSLLNSVLGLEPKYKKAN